MEKKITRSAVVFLILFLFTAADQLFSQTTGTFSFSVTTTANGGYSPKNLLAIWIENGAAAFIKTKIKYSSNGNIDHLATWNTKSGGSTIDAVTGSTRTSHGTITFLWNGTNVAGTVVPDGSYFAWLEMAWGDNLVSDKTLNSYAFTKGTSAFHSTPANTANFSSLVLDWAPLSTGIEGTLESKDINVYPNPSTGLLNIDFKEPGKDCLLQIINESGRLVYNEKITDLTKGLRTFDLSRLSAGVYYCTLHFPEKDVVFSIILAK